MFDIGGGELLLILLVVLVLFGPKKIPEAARMIGLGMQKFKKAQAEFKSQIDDLNKEITKQADIVSGGMSVDFDSGREDEYDRQKSQNRDSAGSSSTETGPDNNHDDIEKPAAPAI